MQNPTILIVLFAGMGLMMFFSVRKQKRQVAETQRMQNSVVAGTRVMTTSGLHGTVTAVADDTIELEISPGVYTTWVRSAVREVVVAVPAQDGPVIDQTPAPGLDDAERSGFEAGGSSPAQSDNPPMLQKRHTDLG